MRNKTKLESEIDYLNALERSYTTAQAELKKKVLMLEETGRAVARQKKIVREMRKSTSVSKFFGLLKRKEEQK